MKKLMVLALAIGLALGFNPALAQVNLPLGDEEILPLSVDVGFDIASIYATGDLVFGVAGPDNYEALELLSDFGFWVTSLDAGFDIATIYGQGGVVETMVAASGETIIDMRAPVRLGEEGRDLNAYEMCDCYLR